MYEFFSDASKIYRVTVTQDGVAVDIRNNTVRMVLHSTSGSDSQVITADVATNGETGIAILQCDFTVSPGIYDVEIDYIVSEKVYVQQRMVWKCLARVEE